MNNSEKMPVLFLGHGSPMNAIEENEFVVEFRRAGREITKPRAILCISAHWETQGTWVTAIDNPETIHDFGGFPKELYEVQYPAPGSPEVAMEIKAMINKTEINLDNIRGLDHGAWSVIRHMYPNADVPVIQMSLDYTKSSQFHYEFSKELAKLREMGILIIGSGNMVHNLQLIAWNKLSVPFAYDWAVEAKAKMKNLILSGNDQELIDLRSQEKAFHLAIPTPEHYLPLLYTLALKEENDLVSLFNDQIVGGSVAMTSLKIN